MRPPIISTTGWPAKWLPRVDDDALDTAILAAHHARDGAALTTHYSAAAARAEAASDIDAACFFLTQAYIFALEAGVPEAPALRARLAAHGRIDP